MSIILRTLAALLIAATLLAATEDDADTLPLTRMQLFPPVALAPADGFPTGRAHARQVPASSRENAPRLAYAVWNELGDSIREADLQARARRLGSPLEPSDHRAAAPRAPLAPGLAGAEPAAPVRVVPARSHGSSGEKSPRLDLYPQSGIFTPKVDGLRGYLELHLIGDLGVGVGVGFAIDF